MSTLESASATPPTAVLCEDEELVRELVRDVLEMEGFSVASFSTADAGWDYLQNHLNEVVLLVSDIRMPGRLDGIDLARLAANACPELHVVLSSAYCAGADLPQRDHSFFLSKPWKLEHLIQVCHKTMEELKSKGDS
ncbi:MULTISPECIES: response regulator [unclassified Pseudomonas]|uniref:response regulator n=1 Tax=unclassified Pseudomonas TaxID=196821 RepID=UPI002580AE6E|nr:MULTISPECIES: response regulator [unclassified Pseudomonas]